MFNYDYEKAQKHFYKLSRVNPEFDYASGLTALHKIEGELGNFERANKNNEEYNIFHFDTPSKIVGPSHRASLLVERNLLNIYNAISTGKNVLKAIEKAKMQIENSPVEARLIKKEFYHYEFALKYLLQTGITEKSDFNQTKKQIAQNFGIDTFEVPNKNASAAMSHATEASNALKTIIANKSKSQEF